MQHDTIKRERPVIQIYRKLQKDPVPFNVCDRCADNSTFRWILRRALILGAVKRVSSGNALCDSCQVFTKGG